MPITVPPLVLRIPKGAPVTVLEEDTNWQILRNAINGLGALFGLAFNDDGTLKALPDRFVFQRNLVFPYSFYAVDTGTPNALAIAFVPPAAAYVAGMNFFIKLSNPITGITTLNVDGLGAIAVKKNGATDLATGDGAVGQVIHVVHNGVNFQLINTFATTSSFVHGVVSNGAGADNVTVLGPGDTQIGTHQLALPVGKRWTWVRHVFSTEVRLGGGQRGIDQFKVKIAADLMPWVSNLSPAGYLASSSGDDRFQVTWITEGEPTGHDTDANLQINTFARQNTGFGDVPSQRKMYSVGWWQ